MVKKLAGFICLFVVLLAVACAQTDAGITTSVKSKLAADDVVKAHEINVDTTEGVVSLTGAVATPAVKERAVELARSTDGVTSVVDNLTVTPAAADRDLGDETAATTGRWTQSEPYARRRSPARACSSPARRPRALTTTP